MCGIAGYSVSLRSGVDRTLAAQALLAGIADRGADAVGYAYRGGQDEYAVVTKQRTPASRLLERIMVPQHADELLIHVRDYTKGHPSIPANNHPVRHGPVVGIHNGIIVNDDELLGPPLLRALRTSDVRRLGGDLRARRALARTIRVSSSRSPASMATAWLDQREPGTVFAARGVGRPLWLGRGRNEVFFASTRAALEIVSEYTGVRLRMSEVRDGTFLQLRDGRVAYTPASAPIATSSRRATCRPSVRRARALTVSLGSR